MGLQEILDEIQKNSQGEIDDIINHAKVTATQIIANKTSELESFYEKKRQLLQDELVRLDKKLHAKAELDAQREKYRIETELVNSILEEAFQNIVGTLRKDKKTNIDFITDLIERTFDALKVKEMEISLNAEDKKIFDDIQKKFGKKISFREIVHISGGVICQSGISYVDNSIDTIFERLRPRFIQWIFDEILSE